MRIVLDTNSLIQSASPRSIYHYHFNLITADPDDNKFVDCAIQANAHYIVTNDHHYDVLRHIEFPKVGLIKLMDFLLMIHG